MNQNNSKKPNRNAFSLIEIIVVLSMAAMIIIATLNIHSQVRKAAAVVGGKIDSDRLPVDILQRIAEDIDRLSTSGSETQFIINNKVQDGTSKSRLIISNYYYDRNNNKRLYEQVVWQSHYDTFEERNELLRSHGGIALEDSLLDVIGSDETATSAAKPSQAEMQEKGEEPFIFICSDFTFFEFSIPQGPEKDPLFRRSSSSPPQAVTASISFAEPIEDVFGEFIIPPEQLYSRTIATDRVRKIRYKFVRQEYEHEEDSNDIEDPNDVGTEAGTDKEKTDEIISTIEASE